MKSLSVLQKFSSSNLANEPFPYLIIENALPADLYERLAADYPSPELIFGSRVRKDKEMKSNSRYDIAAQTVHAHPELDLGLWREFVFYHTSQEFLDELMDKLGDVIAKTYPNLMTALKAKTGSEHPRAGVRRYTDAAEACDFALDCQVGMNSPVLGQAATSVKSLHLDDARELFAGLFYCRDQADKTEGGDLLLYKRKPGNGYSFYNQRYVRPDRVEIIGTVPYSANTFALLFNGLDSIHAVSPRAVTTHHRRLVNIIAEVYPTVPRLFDERPYAEERGLLPWLKRFFG